MKTSTPSLNVGFYAIFGVAVSLAVTVSGETFRFEKRTPTRIEPGTIAEDGATQPWNRLLLVAKPNLTRGDTAALTATIRDSVSAFRLTIMAKTSVFSPSPGEPNRHRLDEIGIGYAAMIRDKLTVVDVASASKLGLELDFVPRQILSENESQLRNVSLVAQGPTLAVFDASSIMYRDKKHQDFVTRHFIWLESATGKLTLLIWLIEKPEKTKPASVADEPMRLIAVPTYEDRLIHIDGNGFFLGIPSKKAFALEELPPGRSLPWPENLKSVAALQQFDESSLAQLAKGFNGVFENLR